MLLKLYAFAKKDCSKYYIFDEWDDVELFIAKEDANNHYFSKKCKRLKDIIKLFKEGAEYEDITFNLRHPNMITKEMYDTCKLEYKENKNKFKKFSDEEELDIFIKSTVYSSKEYGNKSRYIVYGISALTRNSKQYYHINPLIDIKYGNSPFIGSLHAFIKSLEFAIEEEYRNVNIYVDKSRIQELLELRNTNNFMEDEFLKQVDYLIKTGNLNIKIINYVNQLDSNWLYKEIDKKLLGDMRLTYEKVYKNRKSIIPSSGQFYSSMNSRERKLIIYRDRTGNNPAFALDIKFNKYHLVLNKITRKKRNKNIDTDLYEVIPNDILFIIFMCSDIQYYMNIRLKEIAITKKIDPVVLEDGDEITYNIDALIDLVFKYAPYLITGGFNDKTKKYYGKMGLCNNNHINIFEACQIKKEFNILSLIMSPISQSLEATMYLCDRDMTAEKYLNKINLEFEEKGIEHYSNIRMRETNKDRHLYALYYGEYRKEQDLYYNEDILIWEPEEKRR